MRKIEFFKDGSFLKVKVEGKVIQRTNFEISLIKRNLKNMSPDIQFQMWRKLSNLLEENGPYLTPEEISYIVNRYKKELE